jgi:sugar/nucleoside kinase (ribokinase family)
MTFDLLVIGSAPLMACGAARLGLSVAYAGQPEAVLTEAGVTVVEEPPRSVRHVHATSFYQLPELAAELAGIFKEAKAAKATTSLTPNEDPSGRWDRVTLDPVLRSTDYLLPTAGEALALTGHHSVADAAGILARRGPLVVVKNGPEGVFAHNGARVVATSNVGTGTGDGFDAGWVAAVLNGLRPGRALQVAAACGLLSTRATGAQPTWEEATA